MNDLVCRGKVDSLNIVKVLMRFMIGRSAFAGDLTQFYNSCKLTPQQWNLQRFLWLEDLDPTGKVLEGVITFAKCIIYPTVCTMCRNWCQTRDTSS